MSTVRTESPLSSIADAVTRAMRAGEKIAEDRVRLLSLEFRDDAQKLLLSIVLLHLALWAGIGGALAFGAGILAYFVPELSPALLLAGAGAAQLLLSAFLLVIFYRRRT